MKKTYKTIVAHRYFVFGLLSLFFTLILSCQQTKNSSTPTANQEKINNWYQQALKLRYNNLNGIPKFADSIDKAAIDEPNDFKAKAYIARGTYFLRLDNLQKTFENFNESERLLQNSTENSLIIQTHNGLGNYYSAVGDYPKALEELLNALKMSEQIKDTIAIAVVNSNLGQLYFRKEDTEQAKINFNRTLLLLENKKHEPAYLLSSHAMANIYGMSGDFNAALKIDEEGLRITDSLNSDILKVTFLDNKANCFMYSGQLDSAEIYFKKCLQMDIGNNNKKQIADSYSNLAQLAVFSNDEAAVLEYADKSISLSKEISYTPGLTKIYQALIDFYKTKNNPEKVSEYQNLYLQVYKKLLNERKEVAMVQFQTQYETEKKENELLISEATVSKKTKQLELLGLAVLALLIISYFVYKYQKAKNKQQHEEFKLKSALHEIENQNQLQEQRLEISRDLHDNIGAQLTCIIASVDNLKYSLGEESNKAKNQLSQINTITKETIVELRDTIWAMNSKNFSFEDLRARIYNFIVKIENSQHHIKLDFHIDENLQNKELPSLAGINLYRVIQEAVNNSLKHSEANKITIEVREEQDGICVYIKDNGKGFEMSKTSDGNGILNMQKRMEDINGTFKIETLPNIGTKISICLKKPIDND